MILIDLVYINSPGGFTISKLLLDHIIDNHKNYKLLIDTRNSISFKDYPFEKSIISKSEFSRYYFFIRNQNLFQQYFISSFQVF